MIPVMRAAVHRAVDGVRDRIATAAARAGRDPASVRLVAVAKGFDFRYVDNAIAAGVTDIGENRVHEVAEKRQHTLSATWHMVGHLQTNKAARAAALFDVVHSIDSARIARALADHRAKEAVPLRLLVEVDLTGMPQRTGAAPGEIESLVHAIRGMSGVDLIGLMTIAPPADDIEHARPYFARLREIRDRVQEATGHPLPELSMGMSSDFEVAVEEGATMLRVGRAIFAPEPAGGGYP